MIGRYLYPVFLGLASSALLDAHAPLTHEEGVLTLSADAATVGSSLRVTGTDFTASTSYRLALQGALDRYELEAVEADAEGSFELRLSIPDHVRPGTYRLIAVAPDGDESGEAELLIEAPTTNEADADGGEDDGTSEAPAPVARADERTFERSWSGIEWFVIGAIMGGALVGGAALYRGRGSRS